MSNNTNLSKLANVLDDGSSGQFLKSTGSGGVVFDTVAAGTTTVADITALEALSAAQGDMAFVLSNDNVYIRKTAGWYKIATVTNNQLQSVTVTMSGGGTAGDPYALALDGTDTLATGAATDPEGLSVTWSAAPISPTTLSGSNIVVNGVNVATITQGTGSNTNVFTLDPVATSGTHNFSLRFSVTDGINATIDTDKAYTLNFITSVADSKYTVLLAEGQGAGNNKTITDSGGSNTVSDRGSPAAGAFSPYRSGGYSAYFTGSAGDRLTVSNQASNWSDTGTATIEFWFHSTRTPSTDDGDGLGAFWGDVQSVTAARFDIETSSNDLEFRSWSDAAGNGAQTATIKSALTPNTWYHLAAVKDGQVWKFYLNGVLELTHTQSTTYNYGSYGAGNYHNHVIGQTRNAVSFQGYITDVRVNSNKVYTAAFPNDVPTERLTADSNTTFFYNGTGYIGDTHSSTASNNESVTIGGNVEAKTFVPYDSEEYDAADNGGSIFFDGSNDYMLVNSNTNLGTSTWTLQCWVYMNANSRGSIFDFRPYQSQGSYVRFYYQSNGIRFYESSTDRIISNDTVPIKTWAHVALVRDTNNVIKMYVNGKVQTQTYTSTANFLSATDRPVVGASGNNSSYDRFNGYLSDLKVTIGTAEYTANFVPPTAPISSSNAEVHLKGTDAKILDKNGSSSLDLVGSTTPVGDNTSVVYNGSTIYSGKCFSMTGTTGEYIQIPNMIKLEGTEDFTVEAWVNPDYISNSYRCIFANGEIRMAIYKTGNPQRQVFWNYLPGVGWSGDYNTNTTYSIPLDEWSFLQLIRDNGVFKSYFNGSLVYQYSGGTNTSITTSNTLSIGGDNNGGERFIGKLQGLRVSKGLVRPTTVPTAPFKG